MNIHIVTTVALRIIAVYLGLSAISSLLSALGPIASIFSPHSDSQTVFLSIVLTILGSLYLIGCIIIWPFAPRFAKAICTGCEYETLPKSEINTSNIQVAAISVLGFFILSSAIPSLIQIVSAVLFPVFNTRFETTLQGLNNKSVTLIPWSELIYIIIRLVIGFWFILGSSGLVHLTQQFRNAGKKNIYRDRDGHR